MSEAHFLGHEFATDPYTFAKFFVPAQAYGGKHHVCPLLKYLSMKQSLHAFLGQAIGENGGQRSNAALILIGDKNSVSTKEWPARGTHDFRRAGWKKTGVVLSAMWREMGWSAQAGGRFRPTYDRPRLRKFTLPAGAGVFALAIEDSPPFICRDFFQIVSAVMKDVP
jgi:hypothetical protein